MTSSDRPTPWLGTLWPRRSGDAEPLHRYGVVLRDDVLLPRRRLRRRRGRVPLRRGLRHDDCRHIDSARGGSRRRAWPRPSSLRGPTWTGELGYQIERSPDGTSGWTEIGTTGQGVTSYTDTGLTSATTYYYRVFAVTSDSRSPAINSATRDHNHDHGSRRTVDIGGGCHCGPSPKRSIGFRLACPSVPKCYRKNSAIRSQLSSSVAAQTVEKLSGCSL